MLRSHSGSHGGRRIFSGWDLEADVWRAGEYDLSVAVTSLGECHKHWVSQACLGSDEAPDVDPEGTLWETLMVPCSCESLILASNEASVWVLKPTTSDSGCFSAAKDRNLSQFYESKIKKLLSSLTGKALGMNRCKVH